MSKNKLPNRWDEKKAKGMSEAELLVYRSNLLGEDLRITNFGGGNTSAKILQKDPLSGEKTEVLYVKGSGGDLGSIKMNGFSTLYMEKLQALKKLYRGLEKEDEMVGYLPHCNFNLNTRAASIDTPLHAYLPFKHVDHVHPDDVIAVAAMKNGEKITKKIWGENTVWIPWQRPGYDLGLKLEKAIQDNPNCDAIVLGGHGCFTWGETSKEAYEKTLDFIQKARDYLLSHSKTPTFKGPKTESLAKAKRDDYLKSIIPHIRGALSKANPKLMHSQLGAEVLEFVNSKDAKRLAAMGTSCPDHFLRTKIAPLFLNIDPAKTRPEKALALFDKEMEAYRERYEEYYNRCKRKNSPAMRDPYPVIILIPGIGMLSFAKDKKTARLASEYYLNAINVMRGAEGVDKYVALDEQEAFDIEYWLLEEAKLQRMPKPKSLLGKVAFITGGAGGIGSATAHRFLKEDACVVLTDIDQKSLEAKVEELQSLYGQDKVRGFVCNATIEQNVIDASLNACLEFGGIDILVSNAGIASSSPYDETTLEIWNKNISILQTGYFLHSREAFKIMKAQNIGGSMIFIASKNGLQASPNAAAYCTAKAAEIHLARSVAAEGAPIGIRVNVVNPDAVLRGSKIWTGKWKQERAAAYKMDQGDLEEHYRKRSMLGRNVFPEDIAEATYFWASEVSSKSTGNIINVDAGNLASFTR